MELSNKELGNLMKDITLTHISNQLHQSKMVTISFVSAKLTMHKRFKIFEFGAMLTYVRCSISKEIATSNSASIY